MKKKVKKIFHKKHKLPIVGIILGIILLVIFFVGASVSSVTYEVDAEKQNDNIASEEVQEDAKVVLKYIQTPEQVKTIYMTACVVGTPSFREDLVEIAKTTEINSIIIDVKDFSGGISFDTDNPILKPFISDRCGTSDMKGFIEELHDLNIYVIGRITVFQDPMYAIAYPDTAVQKESDRSTWSDYKGVHFIDPGAKDFWAYIVELAKESHKVGFDELNFDCIRYPSDGPMKDIYFPISHVRAVENKKEVLRDFFEYLHEELNEKEGIVTSADLFGMTTTNTDDLNIGQYLEYTLPYFNYVVPMVYPSHYPKNFNGWANPNDYIYEVVNFAMESAYERAEIYRTATTTPSNIAERVSPQQLRTWIQDFDYGGTYDVPEIKEQFQASYDAGVMSWMIWSPSNRYTTGALEVE